MAEQRNFISFKAVGLEEPSFSPTGDIEIPSGRRLSERIMERLSASGFAARNLTQRDYYGWEWTLIVDRFKLSCVLQVLDSPLLIVGPIPGLKKLAFPQAGRIAETKGGEAIVRLLEELQGVSNIVVLSKEQYERQQR